MYLAALHYMRHCTKHIPPLRKAHVHQLIQRRLCGTSPPEIMLATMEIIDILLLRVKGDPGPMSEKAGGKKCLLKLPPALTFA